MTNRVFQFLRCWDSRVWHIGHVGGYHHADPAVTLCKSEMYFVRDAEDAIPDGGRLCGHCRRALERLTGAQIVERDSELK